jgi:hypothetical protein
LGVGVTPSAWSTSSQVALQVYLAGVSGSGAGNTASRFTHSCYLDGSTWKYQDTGVAPTRYEVTGANAGSTHSWSIAAGGTAGNAISFTQAMTLDASGNWMLGTTTASAKFTVDSGSAGELGYFNSTNANGGFMSFARSGTIQGDIGTASQVVSGGANTDFAINARGSRNLIFGTNNTERARIDSSGNLLVGNTSVLDYGKITIKYAGSTENGISITPSDGTSGTGYVVFENESNTRIGSITRATTTNAVLFNTTSDYRLKTVTGSVTGQGARIDALKPIDYLWTDGGQQSRGFLAHEFQAIYPNSVSGTKDALDANGNPLYQAMQASTPEVIADLVAEIQSLRQRLSAANL